MSYSKTHKVFKISNSVFRVLLLVLIAIVLSSCIPIPYITDYEDAPDTEDVVPQLQSLQSSDATRSTVIETLGRPFRYRDNYISYEACEDLYGIALMMCLFYGCEMLTSYESDPKCFELQLDFDEHDKLTGYRTLPYDRKHNAYEENLMLKEFGSRGDPIAQRLWEQSLKSEWNLKKEVGAFCPNADLGHTEAQKRIGDLYYLGLLGLERDLIRSYVWFSLADKGGNNGATEQLDELTSELSPQQLDEAQMQLEAWEPGQCIRDLMGAIEKQSEDRSEDTRKLAEDGNIKAIYRVYIGMRDEYIEPVSAWEWLCKAADLGYENAQIEVAYWHRESNWEFLRPDRIGWLRKANIRADDRIAYLWYTLAAKGDDKRLRIRDNLFSETLSEKEIAEAKDMVSNWKPGQCQSDLMKVTSER
jgi:TPR repeat protein